MRQSRPLTLLFAVLALGSLICPVTGQEISGSEVWRSGVGDPVMAVALSEDGLYSPVITERNIYVYDQNATVLWRYPVSPRGGWLFFTTPRPPDPPRNPLPSSAL